MKCGTPLRPALPPPPPPKNLPNSDYPSKVVSLAQVPLRVSRRHVKALEFYSRLHSGGGCSRQEAELQQPI